MPTLFESADDFNNLFVIGETDKDNPH
jgi:SNF2 family DNA or RNA helicase